MVVARLITLTILFFTCLPLQAASGDENWECPIFAPPWTAAYVQSLAVFRGDLYSAGYFGKAGSVATTNLARWNGTNWSSVLSLADSSYIDKLAAGDRYLFASGDLMVAGPTNRVPLLRWDGTNSSIFGNGPLQVNGMAAGGPNLYVSGWFTNEVTGWQGNDVQRWDGTNWVSIAGGDAGFIPSLIARGNELFIAGSFSSVGGTAATNIARWDGTNWWPLGAGVGEISQSWGPIPLMVLGTDLYLGNVFQMAGGQAITNLARWDGTNWWPMGGNSEIDVLAFAQLNGKLYAAGKFDAIGGVRATNIAQWNGTNWSAVGGGLRGEQATITSLEVRGGNLYAAGSFSRAGGKAVNSIAKWDGTNWSSLGEGLVRIGGLTPLTGISNKVYFGGAFFNLDGISISNVACWNGTNWSALRQGADDYVLTGATLGNQLYVGGYFLNVDGTAARHVARWNGTNWFPLGSGVDFPVGAMTVFSNTVVAAGAYASVTAFTNPVARWNGTTWIRLASANQNVLLKGVRALAANTNRLFAIADINEQGTNFSSALVQWDGSNWSNIGGSGSCLSVYQDKLYADVFRWDAVSQWTGTNWVDIPHPTGYALTIALLGGDIYLGGRGFSTETQDGVFVSGIARSDGLDWSFLGSGIKGQVYNLLAHGTNIYATGFIHQAGNKPAMDFAIWHEPPPKPEMRIYIANNSVLVAWPNALTNYALQTKTDLIGTNWLPFQQTPLVTGSRSVVTNLATNQGRFFRLKVH